MGCSKTPCTPSLRGICLPKDKNVNWRSICFSEQKHFDNFVHPTTTT
jgi:hypothetical protein